MKLTTYFSKDIFFIPLQFKGCATPKSCFVEYVLKHILIFRIIKTLKTVFGVESKFILLRRELIENRKPKI